MGFQKYVTPQNFTNYVSWPTLTDPIVDNKWENEKSLQILAKSCKDLACNGNNCNKGI